MQIQIQSIHFEAGEVLIQETTEQLTKLEKLYDRIESCSVMLKKEKSDDRRECMVEVRLAFPGGDLYASEKAESFGRAIDRVTDDLKKQIVKHKEKQKEFARVKIVEPT